MKGPLLWVGSKVQDIPYFLPWVGRIEGRYIEPFVGGGALFWQLEKKSQCFLGDVNADLMGFYRHLRDDYAGLREVIGGIKEEFDSKDEKGRKEVFLRLRGMYNRGDFSVYGREVLWYVVLRMGYKGLPRKNRDGSINTGFGNGRDFVESITRYQSDLLKGAELRCESWEWVKGMDLNRYDFVFLDPPYWGTWGEYGSGVTQKDIERIYGDIAGFMKATKARVMVVSNDVEDVDSLLGEFKVLDYERRVQISMVSRNMSYGVYINYYDDAREAYREQVKRREARRREIRESIIKNQLRRNYDTE